MASLFDELLRIRNLREDKAKRALAEAHARVATAEQAVEQAARLLARFIKEMPARIDAEYAKLEEEAREEKGVALHRVQSFRAFEVDMYAQRDGLRVDLLERQKALKQAQEKLNDAHDGLMQAQRARLKIEQLQEAEQKRVRREQERAEEKSLEEFKPHSIFAQLQ